MRRPPRPVGDALRLGALWRPYAVGVVLAAVIIAEYLLALDADWPVREARALAFATLLASQVVLVLSMRSPDRPLWSSARPWSRTLRWVLAVIVAATVAAVEVEPLAELLHLTPFPRLAWLLVAAAAATTAWSEPLKRPVDRSAAGI